MPSLPAVPSELVEAVVTQVNGVDASWMAWRHVSVGTTGAYAVLLTAQHHDDGVKVVAATVRGRRVVGGRAEAQFGPVDADVVALPVSDGAKSWLLVAAPPMLAGDRAVVTTSQPGQRVRNSAARMTDGVALVPIEDPVLVTRLRIVRGERVLDDRVPADRLLPARVPRKLDRIVAMSGTGPQRVQVRTDGRSACRLTVAAFWPRDQIAVEGNPFDDACARIDGSLQLLLAEDRLNSSVAGVAPEGARSVRLRWKDGTVTTVRVAAGPVRAFLSAAEFPTAGPARKQASDLVSAQALNAAGDVLASSRPS